MVGVLPAPWAAGTLALAILAALALAFQRPALGGTTLVAPWGWTLLTLVSLSTAELAIVLAAEPTDGWIMPVRFAAAMSTFCPVMALWGAKRPQDRAWQAIVLSLWVVLSLPSFEWLLFGGFAEIHPARFWFLTALVGLSLLNAIGTRWWLCGLLFSTGQVLLMAPFFYTIAPEHTAWLPLVALVLFTVSWCLPAIGFPRGEQAHQAFDRVWIDFRDAFGVAWSLRVMERTNASAKLLDWPVHLAWHGFEPVMPEGEPGPVGVAPLEVPPAVQDSLRTVLRRFVSNEWIDARAGEPLPVSTE